MKYTIVQVFRDQANTCKCGSHCEKISFDVMDELGNVETYGSECIKGLNIDVARYELKRGIQTLKLDVIKYHDKTATYEVYHKELKMINNVDENNVLYKVVFKRIFVSAIDNNLHELSKDLKTFNYNYKQVKKLVKRDRFIQSLEIGSNIYEKDLLI